MKQNDFNEAIKQLRSAFKALGLPVNNTDDRKAVGMTVLHESYPIYRKTPTGRRTTGAKNIIGHKPSDSLYVTYNCPFDAKGNVIRFGIEQIFDTSIAAIESLGWKWRKSPYGVDVYPNGKP